MAPNWRYADPRSGLLEGSQWQATRLMICRSLALPAHPEPAIAALSEELDQTYQTVIEGLPNNPAVRFEQLNGRNDLVLSHLDKLHEPASLIALRRAGDARLPSLDLPEIILEIAARTGFAAAFTHWPAPSFIDTLLGAMMHNEVSYGTQAFYSGFKLEAVKLVLERGVSVSQVARDLGIGPSVVGRWVRERQADKKHAFPGRGQMKPDDAEVARLKRN